MYKRAQEHGQSAARRNVVIGPTFDVVCLDRKKRRHIGFRAGRRAFLYRLRSIVLRLHFHQFFARTIERFFNARRHIGGQSGIAVKEIR